MTELRTLRFILGLYVLVLAVVVVIALGEDNVVAALIGTSAVGPAIVAAMLANIIEELVG